MKQIIRLFHFLVNFRLSEKIRTDIILKMVPVYWERVWEGIKWPAESRCVMGGTDDVHPEFDNYGERVYESNRGAMWTPAADVVSWASDLNYCMLAIDKHCNQQFAALSTTVGRCGRQLYYLNKGRNGISVPNVGTDVLFFCIIIYQLIRVTFLPWNSWCFLL